MKVFFDTNVYVSEAILGIRAARVIGATRAAAWRVYSSAYVVEEVQRVLAEKLGSPRRLVTATAERIRRRTITVRAPGPAKHHVPDDPADSPILRASLQAGVDILVTEDKHLLKLHPYEKLHILTMQAYEQLLRERGLLE